MSDQGSISWAVDEREWRRFAGEVAAFGRTLGFEPDGRDPGAWWELSYLGPAGEVRFSSGEASYVYQGSVTHLAAGLRDWLDEIPNSSFIDSESVYQAAIVRLESEGDDVVASFQDNRGLHLVRIPNDTFVGAARSFVSEVSGAVGALVDTFKGTGF